MGSKTIENPPEQWKIFRNTHEAIVDEDTFQRVQELRRNKRRPARTGKSNLFSGVAYCADCGEKMYYFKWLLWPYDHRHRCQCIHEI